MSALEQDEHRHAGNAARQARGYEQANTEKDCHGQLRRSDDDHGRHGAAVTTVWAAEEYLLEAGDEIAIQVYQESDLSMKVKLDRTGLINYPYLGNLKATGKTTAQLQQELDQGLRGDILINPSVNVSITRYRNFYIGGEVKSSGGYPFEPGLTVRQAVTLDLAADLNTRVQPGDSITVEEGLF